MKKKFHGNSRPLEVDSINGEYYLTIPEEIYILNITDSFSYRDPGLIAEIKKELQLANFKE